MPDVDPKDPRDWLTKLKALLFKLGDPENNVRMKALQTVLRMLGDHGITWAELTAMPSAPVGTTDSGWSILRNHIAMMSHASDTKRKNAMIEALQLLASAGLELPQGSNAPKPIRNWNDVVELFELPPPLSGKLPSTDVRKPYSGPPFVTEGLELAIEDMYRMFYLFKSPHEYTAQALWVMACAVWQQFAWTNRLALKGESEEGGEGKTVNAEVTAVILGGIHFEGSDKVEIIEDLTNAAYMGTLNSRKIPILSEFDLQEIDKPFQKMFNGGCRRGARKKIVLKGEEVMFKIDGPVMMDGLGSITQQFHRRTIVLDAPKFDNDDDLIAAGIFQIDEATGEKVPRGRITNCKEPVLLAQFQLVHEQLWAWAEIVASKLTTMPRFPKGLSSSARDALLPLMSISQLPDAGTLRERAMEMAVFIGGRETTSWTAKLSDRVQTVFELAMADLTQLKVQHPLNGWIEPTQFNPTRNFQLVNETIYAQVEAITDEFHVFTGKKGNKEPRKMSITDMGTLFGSRSETLWPHPRGSGSSAQGRTWLGLQPFFRCYPRKPATAPTPPTLAGLTPPTPDAPVPPAEPAPPPATAPTPSTPPEPAPKRRRGRGRANGKDPGARRRAPAGQRRGGKSEIIRTMLTRPEGCTEAEVKAAIGWPKVGFPTTARRLGLTLRKEKQGRVTRYWGTIV